MVYIFAEGGRYGFPTFGEALSYATDHLAHQNWMISLENGNGEFHPELRNLPDGDGDWVPFVCGSVRGS